MSTALLLELKQETDRLYIAGSDLAAGDLRLKRLLPKFEALGGQAPVFGKLGGLIRQLIGEEPEDNAGAAWKLQELGLLLGSILSTQSSAKPQEAAVALTQSGLKLSTSLTCRQLAPVEKALTESGGGRYEIITEAFRQGYFADLRLFPLALQALGDPYPELADYVQKHIIPLYGEAVIPYLVNNFDPQGGKREGRKLQMLAGLQAQPDLILAAAESGSDEVRATAVQCLGFFPEHAELLIAYTRDKKKAVREAAYQALAQSRDPKGAEVLYNAFSGKDRELAATALKQYPWLELTHKLAPLLCEELNRVNLENWSKESKERADAHTRIQNYLWAIGDHREACLDEAFTSVILNNQAYQVPGWEHVLEHAADYMARSGTKEALDLLFGLEERYLPGLRHAFRAAAEQLTPQELFNRYVGTWATKLKEAITRSRKKTSRDQMVIEVVDAMVSRQEPRVYQVPLPDGDTREVTRMEMTSPGKVAAAWDPRWLDWFIRQDAEELVCAFARPDHEECRSYLAGKLVNSPNRNRWNMASYLQGLERSGEKPEVIGELVVQSLERKDNQSLYSLDHTIVEQLSKLPPSYADRLKKLQEVYRYESAKQIEYALREMGQ